MPKNENQIKLNIDLLRPQGEPKKIAVRLIHWVLSAGRYLIIFVEILVLAAFVSRFKLDNDISENQDEIDEKILFVQSFKGNEDIIRKFQSQIKFIKSLKAERVDYINFMDKIAAQTPGGVTLSNMGFQGSAGKISLKVTGVAQNNDQLATLVFGLKSDPAFSGVNLGSISLDQGIINFNIDLGVIGKGSSI
ncbi:hypothetical protein A3F00_03605 [Candidatus Daviesbacteria bacterium RIFCSPHIGHO2_12_FULL_37_11]|uniref:Uncharacterized protein n=1 Tax=Candidatus Daviesbacteria bacterium RIFCSPHIGHO2_12_FULL_37_11 TaxID=1797777 RepID=A0A1F5KCV5_9BACT|nr:MAG: hypothetical protein A2111_02790 [Candidatus Daviesbacteria bacterium GWA1_38_6]OGE18000.1 MAG: hypothetical protein A2769_01035 [Candidatus Daviesbacteria bacterium RIFCSPHIGHO2_01_FULL_37_27]OGE38728.1 MAG: hypothetical protein A3F00_03605 [Candidatus Daviesbacteria bacterium RIFCSPHIGHO2_12_FULL_37_11]OGE45817.1 MAG: hypothetical protein A3B39_01145 [Candidatus Daviesbacteria bacterium RIFCSPLOWO2_01_FULL_37_10]